MASDSMRRIAEAEEKAAGIERNAEAQAAVILADAQSASLVRVCEAGKETDTEIRRLLDLAEEDRARLEADAVRVAEEEIVLLRTNVAPRIPAAVAAVRDILIGKE